VNLSPTGPARVRERETASSFSKNKYFDRDRSLYLDSYKSSIDLRLELTLSFAFNDKISKIRE